MSDVLASIVAILTFVPWVVLDFMIVMYLTDRTDHLIILSAPVISVYEALSLVASIYLMLWLSPNAEANPITYAFLIGRIISAMVIAWVFGTGSIIWVISDHYKVQRWVAKQIKGNKKYKLSFVECSKDVLWMFHEHFLGKHDDFCPYCGRRYHSSVKANNCCPDKRKIHAPHLFRNDKVHSWEPTRIVPTREYKDDEPIVMHTCPRCKGDGHEPTEPRHFCYRCDGMGQVRF